MENFTISCLSQYGLTTVNLGAYLSIRTATIELTLKVDLNLQIKWNYQGGIISEMTLTSFNITSQNGDLNKLKRLLDCRVTYRGIHEIYQTEQVISSKKGTEVSIVRNLISQRCFVCKNYHKNEKSSSQARSEINMLTKLRGFQNIVQIYEVYETQSNIYLILEKLDHKLQNDYYHEEIQFIVYQLIKILTELQQKKIVHNNLTKAHILFDENNNIKLISFGKTKVIEENIDKFFDLYQLGQIMLQLYNIDEEQLTLKSKFIPDHGINFIKGLLNLTEYRLSVNLANTHPYITSINGDSQIQNIKHLELSNNIPRYLINSGKNELDKDLSTTLF